MSNVKNNAFSELKSLIQSDLDKVNALIIECAKSQVEELIPEITNYIISSGGKRLRPILTLAVAKMFNCPSSDHTLLATAVEFIHTATLLHDDVIDESPTRRGFVTANRKWGNKASILVGDYLFSQSFKLMVKTSSLAALEVLASASSTISEGEVWQLTNIANLDISEQEYLQLINSKTAALFAAACEVGAIISNASEAQIKAVSLYGLNLGMAFQIVDDILDYTASENFGKKIGKDFEEGKITLPFILVLKEASSKDKNFLSKAIQAKDKAENFEKILGMLHEYNAFAKALTLAEYYANQGIEALQIIGENKIKILLKNLIIESVSRKY